MTATQEREKLRSAIASAAFAATSLDEARLALNVATSAWSAANEKIAEINREIDDVGEFGDSSDGVIATLARGDNVDILQKPIDELRKRLEDAERESAHWNDARSLAEEAIEARARALDLARHYVDSAAQRVADAEIDITAMLCAAEGARRTVLDFNAKLTAIARALPDQSEQRRRADNFVADSGWLIDASLDRPAAQSIVDMFVKLRADADAEVKV